MSCHVTKREHGIAKDGVIRIETVYVCVYFPAPLLRGVVLPPYVFVTELVFSCAVVFSLFPALEKCS